MHTVILLLVLFLNDGSVKSTSTPVATYDDCEVHASQPIDTLKSNDGPHSAIAAGWAECVPAEVALATI